jgi:adenylate kinase
MRKFVIMGVPGCGKGTQSDFLKNKYDLVHISVGDILRWNIQNHTKLAARIKKLMAGGRLIPDEFVEQIVKERLQQHDWNYGFILDGFPRNVVQAEFFLETYDIDAVIFIDLPDSEVLNRILSRRICGQCGKVYNLNKSPPQKENVCDVCGGQLLRRSDDNETAVQERLDDYREKTVPAIDLFRRKELVIRVDGSKPSDEVQSEIQAKCGLTRYRIKEV